MKDWFDGLQPREKLILAIGIPVAIVLFSWIFIWRPLNAGTASLRGTVARKETLVADLYRAEALHPDEGDSAPAARRQPIMTVVNDSAKAYGLPGFSNYRPEGNDSTRVSFEDTSFDLLLDWLISLHDSQGISVEYLSASNSKQPGFVSGQIQLVRN